jgi:predicted  nucleic acid-binding Zn-ribbon protein
VDAARRHRWEHVLNADPTAQARLLDLQDLDARLDQAAHRRRTLPQHAEIARLSEARAAIDDEVVRAQTECSDLEREQTKADADVEQVRARAGRNQHRLDSGQVGSAKDLENLQHELTSLARRQAALEEIELEIMERLEIAQGRQRAGVAERDLLDADLRTQSEQRDAEFASIDAQTAGLAAERATLAASLPPDLLALYEKLREQFGGVGAAALKQRRCEGCRLEINSTELGRIRAAPAEEVIRCEECRRILVRLADSGL